MQIDRQGKNWRELAGRMGIAVFSPDSVVSEALCGLLLKLSDPQPVPVSEPDPAPVQAAIVASEDVPFVEDNPVAAPAKRIGRPRKNAD